MSHQRNTEHRRVYRSGRHTIEITLQDRRLWCWRVLEGDQVVGEGTRYSLDRARRDAEWTVDAAKERRSA